MARANVPAQNRKKLWRVNKRALIILAVAAVIVIPGAAGLWLLMQSAGKKNLLAQAERLRKNNDFGGAAGYLEQYLAFAPDDLDALELKCELWAADPANWKAATELGDRILAADSKRSKTALLLVKLNLDMRMPRSAEIHARKLIEMGKGDAEVHKLLAQAILMQARPSDTDAYKQAAAELQSARKIDPKDSKVAAFLAELYATQLQDPAAAVAVLDDLAKQGPDDPQVPLVRSGYFERRGDLKQSEKELDRALVLAPNDFAILLRAAEIAMRQGDLDLARKRIDSIPKKERENANNERENIEVQRLLGRLAFDAGDLKGGINELESGLAMSHGGDARATFTLAEVLLQLGRAAEADPLIAQFRRLSGGDSPTPETRYLVALRSLTLNRPAQAIEEFEKLRRSLSGALLTSALENLGTAYLQVGNEARAEDAFSAATASDTSRLESWLQLARLRGRSNRVRGIQTLQTAISLNTGNPRVARLQLELAREESLSAIARGVRGNKAEAMDRLEALLAELHRAIPANPQLILIDADQLALAGKTEEANTLLREAVKHHPTSAELWIALAQGLARVGAADEALDAVEKAKAASGDSVSLRLAKSRIQMLLGRNREAREALTRYGERDAQKPADLTWLEAHPEQYLPLAQQVMLWENLAVLELQEGDIPKARKALENWSRLAPDVLEPKRKLVALAMLQEDRALTEVAVQALKPRDPAVQPELPYKVALIESALGIDGRFVRNLAEKGEKAEAQRILDRTNQQIAELEANHFREPETKIVRGAWLTINAAIAEAEGNKDKAAADYDKAIDSYREALELKSALAAKPLIALLEKRKRYAELERLKTDSADLLGDTNVGRISTLASLAVNEPERARQLAAEVIRGNPERLDLRVWQADLLRTLGKADEGLRSLQEFVDNDPKNENGWLALLLAQVTLQKLDQARTTLTRMHTRLGDTATDLVYAQAHRIVGDRAAADRYFDRAIEKKPDDLRTRQIVSGYYIDTNRFAEAAQVLKPVMALKSPPGWASRSMALVLSAQVESESAWNEAIKLVGAEDKPDESPGERFVRAQVYARGGSAERTAKAIAILESLAKEYPASELFAINIVNLYLQAKNYEKARVYAARLAENDQVEALERLTRIVIELKDASGAEKEWNRLARKAPDSAATIELHARLLRLQDKTADAVALLKTTFDAYAAKDSGEPYLHMAVRTLADFNELDAARELAKKTARRWPAVVRELAAAVAKNNQVDEALTLLSSSADSGSGRQAALSAFDIAIAKRPLSPKQLEQVEKLLTGALEREPKSIELLNAQALTYSIQSKFEAAGKVYENILEIDPNNMFALNSYAWLLGKDLGKPERGLELIDKAIHFYGKNPSLLDTRGIILFQLHKYDEALADFQASARAAPRPSAFLHLALLFNAIGKKAEAEKAAAELRRLGGSRETFLPDEFADFDRIFKGES